MRREVTKAPRVYRESDAPSILAKAVELGCHENPAGTNRSWHRLRTDVAECCAEHLNGRHRNGKHVSGAKEKARG